MAKQKVSKEFIIREALKLFRDQGYHKTSMADIGTACGLFKGSIYHYFKSKEELAKEAISYLHIYYRDNAFGYAYDEKLGAEQRLKQMARFHEELFFSSESGCFMANIAMETGNVIPVFADMIREFFVEWIDAMANIFKTKYELETAVAMARESVAEIEGATLMMRIFDDKTYLKQAQRKIYNRFMGENELKDYELNQTTV